VLFLCEQTKGGVNKVPGLRNIWFFYVVINFITKE
jgi:hypothetical protein